MTRWLVQNRGGEIDIALRSVASALRSRNSFPRSRACCSVPNANGSIVELESFAQAGAPRELALRVASMLDAFSLLDVVEVAQRTDRSPAAVAPLYYALSERYDVDRLLMRITRLPRDDRWQALARAALRSDLYSALAGLDRTGACGGHSGRDARRADR